LQMLISKYDYARMRLVEFFVHHVLHTGEKDMSTERREHFKYMKNKYLTKLLCMTLMTGMALSGPASVLAAADADAEVVSSDEFDSSGDEFTDGGDSEPDAPTPEPDPDTPTPTPVPDTPTPTPEPVTPTPTPGNLITKSAQDIIDRINALHEQTITLEKKSIVQSIRAAYETLTVEEKAQVSNYNLLTEMEASIAALEDQKKQEPANNNSFSATAQTGTPVYYASNIHAGKDFYLDSLKKNYNLTFSDDFASVMDEIEKEYKEKNKLTDVSDAENSKTTTSADGLLVRNWQDILAVYVYQQNKAGQTEYKLDSSCKGALAEIFAQMNPVVRDKQNITHVTYGNRKINYYIKKNKISKKDRKILKKYVETDCELLCAVVTASKGFVRESVGDDVSEERVNVISAAYSLVGKVGYFWGGKSTVLGVDPSWGATEMVSAEGSKSTGTLRAYGLDCSGFVTWAVINGYQNQGMQDVVGDGTSDQWEKANVVSEADAQPGDLVFQKGPEAGSDNHVGILCGKTDAGDWIAVHCSSGKNGVTVGEAYSACFRYIRQPSFYPTEEQQQEMQNSGSAITSGSDIFTSNVAVSNTLQNVLRGNGLTDGSTDNSLISAQEDFSSESSITSVSSGKIDLSKGDVTVFKPE
jgi:cell wall-associated NlpC family hydrolase